MHVSVKLPSQISSQIGEGEIQCNANSANELAKEIAKRYPQITSYLFNSRDEVRDSLIFYVHDKIIGRDDKFPEGAIVEMMFAISGG
jgi:molybdopterin converting factor small subunit